MLLGPGGYQQAGRPPAATMCPLTHSKTWSRGSFGVNASGRGRSHRIELAKQEKAAVGKPSFPRPELDILAYKSLQNPCGLGGM